MTEENSPQWTPPPPPEKIVADPPQMSEVGSLFSIFFEPGRVFEDLRRKPRFILAGLIIVAAATVFQVAFLQKIGFENIIRDRIESSSRTADLSKEQKEQIIAQQSSPVVKAISIGIVPVFLIAVFFLGGLIYWLGSNAMGGETTYLRGVAVWVYSSLPITILFVAVNLIVLMLKSVDDIDIGRSQGGLIQANPSMFVDNKAMPVVAALLGSLDFFAIWGWILAAIGLQRIAKISAGAAWAIVLIVGLFGVGLKVIGALVF